MTRILILIMAMPLLLAGCGSSTNTPAPGAASVTPPIADKPDVIITVDGSLTISGNISGGDALSTLTKQEDRKSTRLNSSHLRRSRMPSSA